MRCEPAKSNSKVEVQVTFLSDRIFQHACPTWPLFSSIDAASGEIRTARCCLDRESTQRYTMQVVATDGGGLKGEYPVTGETRTARCWLDRESTQRYTM